MHPGRKFWSISIQSSGKYLYSCMKLAENYNKTINTYFLYSRPYIVLFTRDIETNVYIYIYIYIYICIYGGRILHTNVCICITSCAVYITSLFI